jgi:hypothetical protein
MDPLVIPIVAILMPLVLVPSILTLKHWHARREWAHLERMKAMELGLPVANRPETWGPKSVVPIGAGVPIASVFFAFLTCTDGPPSVEGVPIAAVAWGCAALISAGAMITSLILAFLLVRSRERARAAEAMNAFKPAYDPDAFDVVGSRA